MEPILTHYFVDADPSTNNVENALCVDLGDGNVHLPFILSLGEEDVTCPNCLAFLVDLPLGL